MATATSNLTLTVTATKPGATSPTTVYTEPFDIPGEPGTILGLLEKVETVEIDAMGTLSGSVIDLTADLKIGGTTVFTFPYNYTLPSAEAKYFDILAAIGYSGFEVSLVA